MGYSPATEGTGAPVDRHSPPHLAEADVPRLTCPSHPHFPLHHLPHPPPPRPHHTQGRLLIRKEQEATLKGFKIGEVLHSAYFDLEFPTLAKAGTRGPPGGSAVKSCTCRCIG